jgi:ElaB/YqjD/DUF883 family membrane-anchored ribosome-binding protein
MKNLKTCNCPIENTVTALEQAIESKKNQMHRTQVQSASSAPHFLSHVFSEILNRAGGSYGRINQVLEQGTHIAQNFIKNTQHNVEERPWDVLRKVAVYSFGIGVFLSRRHRKSSAVDHAQGSGRNS